jgi:alpha-beta hydrolase superfamily lysophospholipase
MQKGSFTFKDAEGKNIFVYKWSPETNVKVKAVVQIAHGLAEHAGRYERFAEKLTENGYIVYANDHRGHGKTAGSLEEVGYLGEDGFNWMAKDMKELNDIVKKENPELNVFLFGHSMGSLLAQRYICLYGNSIRGVVLSGTSGKMGFIVNIGIVMAAREVRKFGPKARSIKLNSMSFENYNKSFKSTKTDFDWLSRDNAEVEKYINDPYCGGVFTSSFFYDFLRGLKELHKMKNMKNIPKDLPIYVINGDKDPVGSFCKTVNMLLDAYNKLGIKDVSHKYYKDARHEILNEINRDEVMQDVIDWLESHN